MNEQPAAEVLAVIENRLGHLTLNRPQQLNALTFDMVHAVLRALQAWESDSRVNAVLIDGAGERGLCAGGDIKLLHQGINHEAVDPMRFWAD